MKYDEAENRKKLHELLDIVLDANGIDVRKRDVTGTLPTLFFEFSGHVAQVSIRLHKNGWQPSASWDRSWDFYTNEPMTDKHIESVRAAVSDAMKDTTEVDLLASDIARAEKDLEAKKRQIFEMKRGLKKMQGRETQK